jgi:biopolymer transport protein ExbD
VARKPPAEGINEPNMTPLIDVSLVLVVILMVATPMALQSGIAVSRAGEAGANAAPARSERIEIAVRSGDKLELNGRPVALATLGAALQPLIAASATRQVVITCDDDVPHGTFVMVLDEARRQGAVGLGIAGGKR